MRDKTDRRTLRTRQQLREALFALAEEKSIEQITVKELTERAGLNRGTFYLHHEGMDDFYDQLKTETLEDYYKIIKKLGYRTGSREPFINPPAGFVRPFEYIQEHRNFFKIFLGTNGDKGFTRQMAELLKQQFEFAYLMNQNHNEKAEIPINQLYLFAYLASAYIGSLQLWIQRDFDLSPSEMAVLFSRISRLGSANLDREN